MSWSERSPPDERRASSNSCALASNSDNAAQPKPLAHEIQAPATEIIAELRFRRHVERVHSLGARAIAELLAELGSERSIQHLIDCKVERYADLDPDVIQALGGDRFASTPLTVVTSADEEPAA